MSNTRKTDLKRGGAKLDPMHCVQMRIHARTWEKLGWMATAEQITKADLIRRLLYDASKNATPPDSAESAGILAPEAEWKAWREMADQLGTTVDQLVRKCLNGLVKRARG